LPALIAAQAAQENLRCQGSIQAVRGHRSRKPTADDSTASVGFDLCRHVSPAHLPIADYLFDADYGAMWGVHAKPLFDVALAVLKLGRPTDWILTLNADSRPATRLDSPDRGRDCPRGVVGVGGRITPIERTAELQQGNASSYFLDIAYRRAIGRIALALAPEAHDPFSQASPALRRKFRCHCGRLRTGRRACHPAS